MAINPGGRRFIPSVVGLALFSTFAALYLLAPAAYFVAMSFVGVKAWAHPFIDGEFMYVMKASWLRGVDIYTAVPDDVVLGNRMVYSPLWPRLPLPTDKAWTVPVALATNLGLLLAVSALPPARSWRDVTLVSLAVCSTMVVFALERNNIDVWIFLVVMAGGLLLRRSAPVRVVGYGLFVLVGILKYYPVTLLGLVAAERPWRAAVILAGSGVAFAWFVLAFWPEIQAQLAVIPGGWQGGDLIGIVNLPRAAANQVSVAGAGLHKAVELGLRLVLTVGVVVFGVRLGRRSGLSSAMAALDREATVWLVAGCLLMGGCLLTGQSVGYRGVHLLFLLTGLLALLRVTQAAGLARGLRVATGVIVILMWMEAIRSGVARTSEALQVPGIVDRLVWIGLLVTRELLWLGVEALMVGVITVFLAQSASGVWVQRILGRRLLPA